MLIFSACAENPPTPVAPAPFEVRVLRDIDYAKNTYFFLDHPAIQPVTDVSDEKLEVFQSVTPFEVQNDPSLVVFFGRAWVDTTGDGGGIRAALERIGAGLVPAPSQESQFRLLDPNSEYRVLKNGGDHPIGIELDQPVMESRNVAVRYVNSNGDTTGNYGEYGDTLTLEIIKPRGARPDNEFGYTWAYTMRHVYNLGATDLAGDGFSIQIFDDIGANDTPIGSTIPWIRVFGLDTTDPSGTGPADGIVDLTRGLVDLQRGIVIMPDIMAFAPDDTTVAARTAGMFSFNNNPVYFDIRQPQIYMDFRNEQYEDYSHFTIMAVFRHR